MILRKPYAFFIKNFKLIHFILAALMSYSLYRTKIVLDFFNEYAATTMSTVGQDLTGTYMYGVILLMPLFIIIVTILIMVVMGVKKKPFTFYLINIAIFIYTLVILAVAEGTLTTLETTIMAVRATRLIRDLITISFIAQIFSVFIVLIRSTGFNIKKFDFKKDLQDLQIEESDSEEVEVELNVDSNKTRRILRKNIRLLKYAYKENRLFANLLLVVFVIGIGIVIFTTKQASQKIFDENTYVNGNYFSLKVTDSYLTNKDYKGNIIDEDYYYLILRLNIKTYNNNPTVLDVATTKVIIDKFVYTPTLTRKDLLFDFGNIYNDEKISNEYENKSLIFEIPKQLIGKDIMFSYVDKIKIGNANYDDAKVKINYNDLNEAHNKTVNMKETVDFESPLSNYKLVINSYEVASKFKIDYNFVVSNDSYPSYEYIRPSLSGNRNKAVLKINGVLTKGDSTITGVNDLYDFIADFGKLNYEIGGVKYTQNISFKKIVSQKTIQSNVYYIEVLEEVLNADKISICFTVRNQNVEYILK